MRAVVFLVGNERFAVRTTAVVEVVPCIAPRPVPAAYPGLTGVINYRGRIVPVLDLCLLFGLGPCPIRMSSRILVCDRAQDGDALGDLPEGARYVGLLAQDVTRVATLDLGTRASHPGPRTEGVQGLGRIVWLDKEIVQLVRVREIVPGAALQALCQAAEAP